MALFSFDKRNGECPVCGRDDGACRGSHDDPDYILCATHASFRQGDKVNGFTCVQEQRGHTAAFKPTTDFNQISETERLQNIALKKAREEKREQEREEKQLTAMSADDRHRYFTDILASLSVDEATRADLKQRGFTDEQITKCGFKSVRKNQPLNKKYPANLPGISDDGKHLFCGDGYLVPCRDPQGRIITMQIRLHNPGNGGRYRWLSSPHSKEYGELPLAVYFPSELKTFDIGLVEGTGAKPFLAAEKLGQIMIGASGGLHTSSPKTLKAYIEEIKEILSCGDKGLKPEANKQQQTQPSKSFKRRLSASTGNRFGILERWDSSLLNVQLCSKLDFLTLRVQGDLLESPYKQLLNDTQNSTGCNGNSPSTKNLQSQSTQAQKQVTTKFVIVPDAGFALNGNVFNQLEKLASWIKKEYHKPCFYLDWSQIHKNQKDIDELENLTYTRLLCRKAWVKKYKTLFDTDFYGNLTRRFQKWADDRKKLTADITINKKWLEIPKGIEDECDLLIVGSPLGSGKTNGLIEFLKTQDVTSLLVGYRNTLLYNTIDRANKANLEANHIKDVAEQHGRYNINFAGDDSIKLWGGCADSFYKFNAIKSHNSNYYLIHDEICSVLNHLKGGGTLKGRQQQAIEWDVDTIRNASFSIMMDANVSDKEVDFLRELFPEKRIKVLKNEYKNKKHRSFYFLETASDTTDYSRNSKYLPSQLLEIAKQNDKVLWLSDSQRSCEVYEEIAVKLGRKVYRLDGKTSAEELSKIFQKDPKAFIIAERLDSAAISPSGESGLSIDLYDYFDAVCFDIRGSVGVNTLVQMSARLRDTEVPIYVACPEFINITSDPCPYPMKRVEEVLQEKLEYLNKLSTEADEKIDKDFIENMFADMGKQFSTDKWFVSSLEDGKDLKFEHSNLKLCLQTALQQDGHRTYDLVEEKDEKAHEEKKDTTDEVKRRESDKIFDSPDIPYDKAQELAKKDNNYEEKCTIRKARLKHNLPGIENTDSWNKDFLFAAEMEEPLFLAKRWRLKQLQDKQLANAVFRQSHEYNFENDFQAKDIWKNNCSKIEALRELGVEKIIEAKVFSTDDEWLKTIVDRYYGDPRWHYLIGIPKAKKDLDKEGKVKNNRYVKNMVNRFLDYFGLVTKQEKVVQGKRFYSVLHPEIFSDFIIDIDQSLDKKTEQVLNPEKAISLKAAIDRKLERERSENEWKQQHEEELKQRMLEMQYEEEMERERVREREEVLKQQQQQPQTQVVIEPVLKQMGFAPVFQQPYDENGKPRILMPQEELLKNLDESQSEERLINLIRWASKHTRNIAMQSIPEEMKVYLRSLKEKYPKPKKERIAA